MKATLSVAMAAAFLVVPGLTPVVAQAADAAPYQVSGGNKVDAHTLSGWRTWRALACERCHGAAQEGMVGPSLVNSLKVLTKDQFKETVLKGRIDKGMPNFDGSKMVVENIDNLYAYLKGRSDGAIQPGRLEEMGK
ncbi:c-type cytochrome [Herbaspirillum sp. SJZ107]|uniref:c-type cytochrome n=1 Tax=Herbaspirillum sp. SJZ107 TaxID=2572881 RepID=UPI00115476A9|nr:c-type cytochrome [Herbaspirillum sp. SJZ107]